MDSERTPEFPFRQTREFVRDVRHKLNTEPPFNTLGALDLLTMHAQLPLEQDGHPQQFSHFIQEKRSDLLRTHGDQAYDAIQNAEQWYPLLPSRESRGHATSRRFSDARYALATWRDIGEMVIHKETKPVATQLADLTGQANPDTVKQLVLSLAARATLGELASKPSWALAVALPMLHSTKDILSTDTAYIGLATITLAQCLLKSKQDIRNKINGKPFITIETNVLHSILGWDLTKTSYAVHLAWLLPFVGFALGKHFLSGSDTNGILIAQILTYLGDFGIDGALGWHRKKEDKKH